MGMAHWIDNADSYICPVCGFETSNPFRFHCQCPKCGFMDTKDVRSSDVVEVVRCKNCINGIYDEANGIYKCVKSAEMDSEFGDWIGFISYHNADYYCADGERRADDGETS